MPTILDTTSYASVIALDTQMIFEARPLEELEWDSLSPGPILLLIVPQVSTEVDAKKRDGRLGSRARNFNRLLEPSIETNQPTQVTSKPVQVDIAYVAAGAINWNELDDLERESGDDRIVAQLLNAKIDVPPRIEVMSFDSRPRAAARRHGLKAIRPDESWLLDPEPSPSDRRLIELEKQLTLLQTTEPQLCLAITSCTEAPLRRIEIEPLNAAASDAVAKVIEAKHPYEGRGRGYSPLMLNSNYDEEYDDYVRSLGETVAPNLHKGVQRFFSQYAFQIELQNVGAIAAENVIIELRSGNAVVHPAPFMVNLFGPKPPNAMSSFLDRHITPLGSMLRPDRAYFYLEDSTDSSVDVEYRCQDFRHGRTHRMTVVLELTERTNGKAHIEVRVTAGNMRGEIVKRTIVPVTVEQRPIGDIVDLDKFLVRETPTIANLLGELLRDDPDEVVYYNNDGSREER